MRPVPEVLVISAQTQTKDESEEIEAVLSSEAFSGSPSLSRLLRYLCNNHFSEDRGALNEYRIGVEALGRPLDFDPAKNSSIRVEVHRLRAKLRGYYETEGANHPIRITLEEGHYRLQFVRRGEVRDSSGETRRYRSPADGQGDKLTRHNLLPAAEKSDEKTNRIRRRLFSAKGAAILAAAVVLAFIGVWVMIGPRLRGNMIRASFAPPAAALVAPTAATTGTGPVLILAGYQKEKYIDRDGNVWEGDRYFTGGEAVELKLPYIQGAANMTMYRTARSGDFSYDIPVKPGNYELRLHFVETIFGPGTLAARGESSRVFSVALNGRPLLTDFDVLSDAGGAYRALTRVFKDVSPGSDGKVHLKFIRGFDQPLVNAIELAPETGGRMNPVRIVMQANSFVDHAGRFWGSDQYAIGGVLDTHVKAPANTSDPHLFDGERFGHFNYQIPVAPGRYTVTLQFTEAFFGSVAATSVPGPSRVFDVYANGVALLRNFDIYGRGGGPNRAVTETFRGVEPNAAGLIDLSFVPVKNYACVSAIEVTDETP
ncbi:MAG: malectin domain-containing carbohydrate-binding protein [Terracidiphilus sp.]